MMAQIYCILQYIFITLMYLTLLFLQGGEYEILKSINWLEVKFDVLCIETDEPNRAPGFGAMITAYLDERGYRNSTSKGRNTCKSRFAA